MSFDNIIVEATSGKKGTGKDWRTYQSYLADKDGAIMAAFADWVKTHCYATGEDGVFAEEKTAKTRAKLIETGTEQRRLHGDAYYAIQMLGFIKLQKSRGMRRVLISDLRFQVEYNLLCTAAAQGQFILRLYRIEAPRRNQLRIEREAAGDMALAKKLAEDASETELDTIAVPGGMFEIIHNDIDLVPV